MKTNKIPAWCCFVVLLFGCGSSRRDATNDFLERGDYSLAIIELRAEERKDPFDSQIKRNLGIAYFKTQQYESAVDKLAEAAKMNSGDKIALLYLGLSYEMSGQNRKAAILYRHCAGLDLKEPLKTELLARSRDREIESFKQEIKKNLADRPNTAPPNSIAVLYFRNISSWAELDPALKGLSEILAADLSRITQIEVVPRKKVQLLLEQIALRPEEFLDETRMTDAAKLLGAEMLLTGGVERIDNDRISISAGIIDGQSGRLRGKQAQVTGRLSEILELEKDLILQLIETLKVIVPPSELQAIKQFTTRNSLAFIAFSKGLDFEDDNALIQARSQFKKAVIEDSNFRLAQSKLVQLPQKRLTISEIESLLPKS